MEVYYSNDTVTAHLGTKYATNTPYTISMVDAKSIYSLAEEHAMDLSDQDWVNDTDYAISVNDQVVGFPVCIEARGMMYNADAIEAITGETFQPEKYTTLDAFKKLLDELKAGGMESPVGIMKKDWSLAAHYLLQTYEEKEDPDAFVAGIKDGSVDLSADEKFNTLMDTFDVLMENNYAKDSAIAAEREVSEQKLANGEIAFMFGGNWDWSLLADYDAPANMGIMAVPQNTDDGTNTQLVGGVPKYFFIDSSSYTSEEQKQAAKDFLNWLVYDEAGNTFLTESCNIVPAFKNINAENLDPLSISVKNYADRDAMIPNWDYYPDDHYPIVGASMQEYLAGQIDRAQLADKITSYWKSAELVKH